MSKLTPRLNYTNSAASFLEVLAEEPGVSLSYQNNDIYAGPLPIPELELKTYYEKMHLEDGRKIKYVRFRFE